MIAPFPHRYKAQAALKGSPHAVITAPPRPDIHAGPPVEFGGRDDWWSPEHLLVSSLNLCFMTTFLSLCQRENIAVQSYESEGEGTLEKTKEGIVFTAFQIAGKTTVAAEHVARARELIEASKKYCIVSRTLKAPVTVEVIVVEG